VGGQNANALAPYYTIMDMATYIDVDPTRSGQAVLDAGRIMFKAGSRVNTSQAIAFKSAKTYCVAPVTLDTAAGPSAGGLDFWAVGVDCCQGSGAEFRCGDVGDRRAYAGVRLLDSQDRAYYRLALQQAETTYGFRVAHPLFIHWTRDPIAATGSLLEAVGRRLVWQGSIYASVQATLCAVMLFMGSARPKAAG